MTFEIGEFDQRITIQDEILVGTAMGGQEVSLVDIFNGWAKVRPKSGAERERDDQVSDSEVYLVVIRNYDDIEITPKARIIWRGITLNIRSVPFRGVTPLYLSMDAERGVAI